MIYIGLPQWSHPKWVRLGITSLEEYARHFNCVEGNTTLYALPKPEIVARWYEQTHDDFRFCFKFPATISHQAALRHCDELSSEFLPAAPLASRIGQYWLQLPATFGPRDLPALWHFSRRTAEGFHLRRRSSSSRVFRQRGSGTAAQPRAARA